MPSSYPHDVTRARHKAITDLSYALSWHVGLFSDRSSEIPAPSRSRVLSALALHATESASPRRQYSEPHALSDLNPALQIVGKVYGHSSLVRHTDALFRCASDPVSNPGLIRIRMSRRRPYYHEQDGF